MNWFFIALLAPALWSVSNHCDKYLISRYFNGVGTGALVLFSSLIGLLVLPVIFLFQPAVIQVSFSNALVMIVSGIIAIIGVVLYLYAMKKDEASIVTSLFQTIPVFTFILGYFVLGETLTTAQTVGSLCIIVGGAVLSLDLSAATVQLKTSVLFLMLGASLLLATSSLVFKVVAIETNFWTSTFWGYIGDVTIGIFFLTFIPLYRREFITVLRHSTRRVIGLNVCNELITIVAGLCMRFASLLAPIALVWTINGFQPFFVFLYGVILTKFFPRISVEHINRKYVIQKITAIVILFIGTYIISQ